METERFFKEHIKMFSCFSKKRTKLLIKMTNIRVKETRCHTSSSSSNLKIHIEELIVTHNLHKKSFFMSLKRKKLCKLRILSNISNSSGIFSLRYRSTFRSIKIINSQSSIIIIKSKCSPRVCPQAIHKNLLMSLVNNKLLKSLAITIIKQILQSQQQHLWLLRIPI